MPLPPPLVANGASYVRFFILGTDFGRFTISSFLGSPGAVWPGGKCRSVGGARGTLGPSVPGVPRLDTPLSFHLLGPLITFPSWAPPYAPLRPPYAPLRTPVPLLLLTEKAAQVFCNHFQSTEKAAKVFLRPFPEHGKGCERFLATIL